MGAYHFLLCVLFVLQLLEFRSANGITQNETTSIQVGVVLDLNSSIGIMANICISMAISDFYATHSSYKTRLSLHTRNSQDIVASAFSAINLINNEQVNAIIGPQTSTETKFVISLGEKSKIPIISFSATSPALSTSDNTFFLRTAQDDSWQVEPILSLVQAFRWHGSVIIYEDTDYGNGLVPYLADAFQQNNIRVTCRCPISPDSSDFDILKKLVLLMGRETRVMVVHMTASLGSRLFSLAKEAGMMSNGYVWIVSNGMSSMLETIEEKNVIRSMEGVLGIRPFVPTSKRLDDFKRRCEKKNANLIGLWAYDSVWALAMAAEGIGDSKQLGNTLTDQHVLSSGLRVSEVGVRLRDKLLSTKFRGLSGDFGLTDGQLKRSAFEIINVVGEQVKVIGLWTSANRFSSRNAAFTMDGLIPPVWPGGTKSIPRGWVIPASGKKMRIGVPIRAGFTEYLKMDVDPYTKEPVISGFSYDVFLAVLDKLPFAFAFELFPFRIDSQNSSRTYDELLYHIKLERFDGVIGDIMITANRSQYVDFTLPYFESNVAMVVKIKQDQRKNMWIFLKPFSWDLWLTTVLGFIFTGIVVWVLEHRINHEFRGPVDQQVGTICYFSFSTLVFAQREKLINNLSKFVLIIWVFVVLILTQSYTASLASMLTVQRLQPAVVNADELRRNGDFVGHRKGSYIKEFLIKQLRFDESKLRHYSTSQEFDQALAKGSQNGGVAAIFEAEHILQLFLPQYCSKYITAGPTYKTDGLGFAFPQTSPLVAYMSRAILSVTEDKERMDVLKRKYNLDTLTCQDQATNISSDSLTVQSFGGLFIITGVASLCSLLAFVLRFLQSHWSELSTFHRRSAWSTLSELAARFDTRDPSIGSHDTRESRIHPVDSPSAREIEETVSA